MARVIVSDLADEDTAAMLGDIAREAGHLVADRYNAELGSLFDRLADYPESCQTRPNLGAHVRVGVMHPYLVIYRYAIGSDTVSIVRILHGRRKITRKLLGPG